MECSVEVLQEEPQTSSKLPPEEVEVEEARDGLLSSSPPVPPPELLVRNSLLSRTLSDPPFLDLPPRRSRPSTSPTLRGEGQRPGVASRLCGWERDWGRDWGRGEVAALEEEDGGGSPVTPTGVGRRARQLCWVQTPASWAS